MKQDRSSIRLETPRAGYAARRVQNMEMWAWLCVLAALLAMYIYPDFTPTLGQDSFQYLSIAQNTLDGRFANTSLVHFDAERSFGVIPAPVVTFAPGYPIVLALVGITGFSLTTAGLLISMVSMVACVPLLAWMSDELGISRLPRNIVIAGFVLNAIVIMAGTSLWADALFTFLTLFGVALIVSARQRINSGPVWYWFAAGAAFGLAYLVRYAGLFFIVGLAMLAARYWLSSDHGLARRYTLALAFAGVPAVACIARNIMLVGNWRGGNEKVVSNPLFSILMDSARGANRLFLGPGSGTAGGTIIPRAALVLLFVCGMGWLFFRYLRRPSAASFGNEQVGMASVGMDILLLAVAYFSFMFYAGLRSVIEYGSPRYFLPLLPLLLLLVGLALQAMLTQIPRKGTPRKISFLALAASVSLYAFLNLLVFRVPHPAGWQAVAKLLDSRSGDGVSARAVIGELVGPNGVVIANNGQTVGYLLSRPTVSLVGPHFSNLEWNEEATRRVAHQFNAKAIVIYVPESGQSDDDDILPSTFLKALARGDAPTWMRLAYRARNIIVYAFRLEGT